MTFVSAVKVFLFLFLSYLQCRTKYLEQSEKSKNKQGQKALNLLFHNFWLSLPKFLLLQERPATRLCIHPNFKFSWCLLVSYVVRQLVRQLAYNIKYDDQDCLKTLLFLSTSLIMIEVFDWKKLYFTSEKKFLSQKNTTNKGESFLMVIYVPDVWNRGYTKLLNFQPFPQRDSFLFLLKVSKNVSKVWKCQQMKFEGVWVQVIIIIIIIWEF